MSKTMKKLLSMALSLAMAVTSFGITAMADEETTETAAALATEQSSYETDNYYQKALALCSALGIIKGYDDGSVNPESTITRAEMSAIVLRTLNVVASEKYDGKMFNDLKTDHWAADTVASAVKLGILNGYTDGSFRPDDDVLYEQVEKMIVCALGYDVNAKMLGGYPEGYQQQATSLKLTDHAVSAAGVPAERGLVIKMVYNALITDYNEITTTDKNGNPQYNATRTLAKAKFNVIDKKGTLQATSNVTVSSDYKDVPKGQIIIDDVKYETELPNTELDPYVGYQVTYFYRESDSIDPTVIAVSGASTKTETVSVDVEHIKEISGFDTNGGTTITSGTIKMESGYGAEKKTINPTVIYNGEIVGSVSEYIAARDADRRRFARVNAYGLIPDGTDLSSDSSQKTFDEFLKPDNGTLRLLDGDGDGKYETVFVDEYETMLITATTNKKVTGYIKGGTPIVNDKKQTTDINVDETEYDLTITVTKGGSEAKARNLKKDDVVSLKRSLSNEILEFDATGESITGAISTLTTRNGKYYGKINGEQYEIDGNAYSDAKSGTSATFYLDKLGRIGRIESSTAGTLDSNEQYGWLMTAYTNSDGSETTAKIYTQDGKAVAYPVSTKCSFWAPDASSATSTGAITNIVAMHQNNTYLTSGKFQIRACKYKVNSKGELIQLYMAVDYTKVKDTEAMRMMTSNLRGVGTSAGTISGKTIENDALVMWAPSDTEDMKAESNYSVGTSTVSSFLNSNGVQRDFFIGEFEDDRYANVVFALAGSSNEAASISDYGTADDNPCAVVTETSVGWDSQEQETIYNFTANRSGSEATYTTSKNTLLAKIKPAGFVSGREYSVDSIWTGLDGTALSTALREGDVLGIKGGTSVSVLIKMVDVEALTKTIVSGETNGQYTGYTAFSDTRDGIGIGTVANIDVSDSVYFSLNRADGSEAKAWSLAGSTSIVLINVTTDENGNFVSADVDSQVIEPSELIEFNMDGAMPTGDAMFFRNFKNDAQREVFVYRFND